MTTIPPQPIPRNLREQMIQRVQSMPEDQVAELLLQEKLSLLDKISDGAEREQAEGKWQDLPEFIHAYRNLIKSALPHAVMATSVE
jgi:hypothetical protein